jgi:hypothetical protein
MKSLLWVAPPGNGEINENQRALFFSIVWTYDLH